MEIPLLPAQRHRHAHTISIANLEDEICAEVIWKILALLPKGSMITSWQTEGLGGKGGKVSVICKSSSMPEKLSFLEQQTSLQ